MDRGYDGSSYTDGTWEACVDLPILQCQPYTELFQHWMYTEFECRGPPNTEMKYFIAKFGVRWSTHFIPVTMRFPVECFSVQYLVLLLGQCFLWHKCDYITAYCKTVSTVFSDNHWLNASISPSSTKTILFITQSWKRTLKMAQKSPWLTDIQTNIMITKPWIKYWVWWSPNQLNMVREYLTGPHPVPAVSQTANLITAHNRSQAVSVVSGKGAQSPAAV